MEYTYKPTVKAIQYTGSIDAVIEFFAPVKIKNIEWRGNGKERYIDIGLEDILQNEIYQPAINEYIVKHTLNEEIVKVEIVDEDEFKRYFKQINTPKSLEQAVCDTTESAADTTSCEDKPERSGRVAEGEPYWYISTSGDVYQMLESLCALDRELWESGNYFKSKPEALQARDETLLQLKYRQWRKQHDPVALDWVHEQFIPHDRKYYIENEYDYGLKPKIEFEFTYTARKLGALYFSTNELAERFYIEHKDLIHRVLGVQ